MAGKNATNSVTTPMKRPTAPTHSDLVDTFATRLDEWLDSFKRADSNDETTMSDDAKACLEDLGYLQD